MKKQSPSETQTDQIEPRAAFTGIVQLPATAGQWVNMPALTCTSLIFSRSNFDLASSATPGENYFHCDTNTLINPVPVNGGNANLFWYRSLEAISFIWNN